MRPASQTVGTTKMKMGLRQWIVSTAIFLVVLIGLVSVDDRVRDRVNDLVSGGDTVTPWGDRVRDLGGALVAALRYQSIDNAPMLVFTAVGAVLFVFMLKS